jgi:hypothetical protein
MPALSAADSNASIIAHMQVDCDATIGLQNGEDGLLLTSLAVQPTRQAKEKYNHEDAFVGVILSRPSLTLGFEYETTLAAALIPGAHPGTALTLAEVQSINPGTLMGFPDGEGYVAILSNTPTHRPGDLNTGSAQGRLMSLPAPGAVLIRAA